MAKRDVKTMRGFINYDFAAEHDADLLREVGAGVAAGRNRYREDIVDGLQNVPGTFAGMGSVAVSPRNRQRFRT